MPLDNGSFSGGIDLDAPIYRIHPHRYLEPLLAGKLILRSTDSWIEPYENLITKCCYEILGEDRRIKQVFLSRNRLPTFGQCWSTVHDSDAVWRIYSEVKPGGGFNSFFSRKEGVRLRTTAGKLVSCLANGMDETKKSNCYIAPVKYFEQDELKQYVANAIGNYRDDAFAGVSGHADALLLKRSPFAHEHEIRVLYIDKDREYEGQPQIEIPIAVNNVIEEITLDPRVQGGGQEARRKRWLERNGFKNEINRSLLYLGILMIVPLFSPEELNRQLPAAATG